MAKFENRHPPGIGGKPTKRQVRKRKRTRSGSRRATALAESLKGAYIFHRRLHESAFTGVESNYKPSPKLDGRVALSVEDNENLTRNTWEEIAVKLFQRKIDPQAYVQTLFNALHGTAIRCPHPGQLLSSQCMELYRKSVSEMRVNLDRRFAIQRNLARADVICSMRFMGLSSEDAICQAVTNHQLGITPLFRYCLLHTTKEDTEPVRRLMASYRTPAAVQYFPLKKEYDRVWGNYIPEELVRSAASIYERLIREML